jgi:hypothetical protein
MTWHFSYTNDSEKSLWTSPQTNYDDPNCYHLDILSAIRHFS